MCAFPTDVNNNSFFLDYLDSRKDNKMVGYSPLPRGFEAAACSCSVFFLCLDYQVFKPNSAILTINSKWSGKTGQHGKQTISLVWND